MKTNFILAASAFITGHVLHPEFPLPIALLKHIDSQGQQLQRARTRLWRIWF
jgi:hypothetical protein